MGSARRTPVIFPQPTNYSLPRHPFLILSPWAGKHLPPVQSWERRKPGGLLLGRFLGTTGVCGQQLAHPPRCPLPVHSLGWGPEHPEQGMDARDPAASRGGSMESGVGAEVPLHLLGARCHLSQ